MSRGTGPDEVPLIEVSDPTIDKRVPVPTRGPSDQVDPSKHVPNAIFHCEMKTQHNRKKRPAHDTEAMAERKSTPSDDPEQNSAGRRA